jgi:hypothetical protein
MDKKGTVLVVRMDPPAGKEAEWNNWYDKEHIPSRLALPGFLAIRRFELAPGLPESFVVPGPKYLTVIELASRDAVKSKEFTSLRRQEADLSSDSFEVMNNNLPNRFAGVFEQVFPEEEEYRIPDDAKFLLAVGHADLPPEVIDEYNAWYNTEHIPSYLEIPGVLNARRFMLAKGDSGIPSGVSGPQFIALYDLANDKVFETEEFKQKSSTPWSTRVRGWTWDRRKMNNMYRCIYTARR